MMSPRRATFRKLGACPRDAFTFSGLMTDMPRLKAEKTLRVSVGGVLCTVSPVVNKV